MKNRRRCDSVVRRAAWLLCLGQAACLTAPSWFSRAQAATSTSANYLIITDTTDTGGATFSPNYANRASVEPVTGYSAATIPDATTRFLYHGFVPQLDPPLFAVADVAVTLTASPILSSPTEAVTFSGTVFNQGAEEAPGVLLAITLPANVTFNGMSVSQGNAALVGNVLRCALGTIPAGGTATFSIQTTATANGEARAAASLTVEAVDPHFANNSASALSTVVTAVRFTLPGGGSWYNPAHWSPAVVPGTNHKAIIDGDIVDFYDADATVAGLVLTGGRIGGAHRLTVTTLAEWSGGELQTGLALVIPRGGMLRVTNGYAVNLRHSSGIENHGTVRLESTALQSVFGAWVTNDGLFEVVGNRSFLRFENSAFDFHNRQGAIVRRSAGLGTNSIPVAFRNDGLVEVLTGVVDFNGSFINGGYSLVNTGTNRAGAGAEIRYTKANSFEHGSTFEGPGAHRIIADSMSPGDGTRFSGAIRGDFEILNGIISGAFTNTGRITWLGGNFQSYGAGDLTIPPDSALIVAGGGDRALVYGYTIRNLGTVRLEGAGLWHSGGGIVDNQGLFDIAGDFSLRNGLTFTNRPGAILRKSAGLGTSTATLNPFWNEGEMDLQTGTLALTSDFSPGASASLNLYLGGSAPGTQFSRLTASGVATLNGALRVILKNGFSPSTSDTFQIITAGARVGIFAAVSVDPADGRFFLVPTYLAGGVALQLRPGPAVITTSSAQFRDDQFQFSFQGIPGATYVVEASPVLGPRASWMPIQTNVATAALTLVLDPSAKDQPGRFYRLRLVP